MLNKYQVVVPESVVKSLIKIPLPWRERMAKAIDLLPENPFMGEKLWGKLQGKRKIRIYPYRIIYEVDKKKQRIIIFEAGHRQGIY
ncbi:MAG: type II toxin-antitoxin system mRNA interferase toxin, RelE/StbE family [Candidatus Nealsonbacteria bacterium CG23_combo_of_CG06-09_8_20_14_all_38_19]|uniref:Type II toxin-antitoxin system mRNA interferase toxin, RelE/StbE family n=1 Tax=Candidatus Nealsonbacteria bacterium CG23_combo_of_CG06-09_8_20_14_all_38_19 TaxID=1974721 RepID=A0A2G9YXS0_9BACT|nr:MAG: type II toxin-antitoxin system mRNA interferase toxin, RelE/StbE family [Candidatus Nealsonbacteria bacterium CG23_combo_of_CG06-09_8_20_14_all_38_19]